MKKGQELFKPVLSLFLILVLLGGCVKRIEPKQDSTEYIPPVNQDGFVVIKIPKTLLGSYTAEELEAKDKASRENLDEEELSNFAWSAVVANEDGTISYYFTPEQYQESKDGYYNLGRLRDAQSARLLYSFVEDAEYTDIDADGIPWGLIVSATKDVYLSNELWNSALVTVSPAIMLGRYQILCGIPDDEWSVHIVVIDAASGDTLEETNFPTRED